MQRRFVIGIDGGHHFARAAVLDTQCPPHKPPIFTFSFREAVNPHYLMKEDCIRHYIQLIKKIGTAYGIAEKPFIQSSCAVVLSLAGALSVAVDNSLFDGLKNAYPELELEIVDDTWAYLFGALDHKSGISAVSSLGASVSVVTGAFIHEKRYKLDGWGPIIGDFGSGFQIAAEFFRKMGRDFDRGRVSGFYKKLRDVTDPTKNENSRTFPLPENLSGVQHWFDKLKDQYERNWHVKFAELSFACLEYADENPEDVESVQIVLKAAEDFCDTIDIAVHNHSVFAKKSTAVLAGEMFQGEQYTQAVVKRVQLMKDQNRILGYSIAKDGPEHGALKLAMHNSGLDVGEYDSIPRLAYKTQNLKNI
jgi:N-acetylglucosamine kinase-like BadF-type ATPase